MGCDIIIPVWNQLQLTRDCIEQIARNTRYPFRLIIVDNGSENETREYLQGLDSNDKLRVTLVRNQTNLGFVKAVNQGLRISDAPYVCLLNNDVLVGGGWLTEMVGVAEDNVKIGIVNPESEELDSGSLDEYLKNKSEGLEYLGGQSIEIMGAMGFCMLIKRGVIEKIGLLDEAFGIGGYDDMDYARRAWQAGYKCSKAKAAYVIHRVHSSFDSLGEKRKKRIGRETRAIFWKKWGIIPRVAFVIHNPLDNEVLLSRVSDLAHNLAGDWNIVYCYLRDSAVSFQIRHQGVRLIKYPDRLFLLRCLGEMLKPRKKRLRLGKIFVDNRQYCRLLRLLYFLHRAQVIML
ncbi:glycosyltransferase family 2 protein [Candidatus Omnitrophota bacterium]